MNNDFYGNEIFSSMKGKIISSIVGEIGDEEMIFTTNNGEKLILYYEHDCCASCEINDICGDITDVIGSPILIAEVVTSDENPEGIEIEFQDYSFTWTFYKLDTIKGGVTIRWYGESNGYYSENVTCIIKEYEND